MREKTKKSNLASSFARPPFVSQKKKPRLRLDREALARVSSDARWSREVRDRVEAYRRDVRAGVNPFHGAFPLWRNEQFVAATTELIKSHGPTRGDGGKRLATFAEMEQAVLLEAQRRELRFLNQRDAEERRLNDVEEEEPTCTAVVSMPPVAPLLCPADKSSPEAERVVSPENLHKLAAGLGEDDGEELDIEGDAALEEGLREEKENDASPEAETEKEAAAYDVVGGEKKSAFRAC